MPSPVGCYPIPLALAERGPIGHRGLWPTLAEIAS